MSDNQGILGEILEQGASIVKQTVKQTAKLPSDLAKTAAGQVGGQTPSADEKATAEFVKDLYGADDQSNKKPATTETQKGTEAQRVEKEQKIEKLRQELHSKYYQRTFNPPKQQEERPAEKVEKEKREEMIDLQEKEKKKPPVLVQRARERVEKYPGASG